ncbi:MULTISPECIES: hypothetical protein [unclassified Sphingomonas]|uniref:hypothetical protein n=1 Tax=unclassified Sphingomonas TaxID=196159 RepID=UPI0006FEFB8C|nr:MULTISPECIES: hypothetical protein [unclassified Sphingomonas]KQM66688.1 hypothetical protein ASE65_00925 [Sphingomonas sp. Leaf16]KQN17637.1 hypothetical protein ASE81_00305 [Sphingomonas sp. Leaf29]KQN23500.1 hypothetical protein ASE83_03185 [Sphingomonas sp. Leaf32]
MAKIGTIWDRAVDFVRDHLGEVMPVLLVTQFAVPAVSGSLNGLRAEASGGTAAALGLLSALVALVSLWGALYLIAFAAQPDGQEQKRVALSLAKTRFLPMIGISIVMIVILTILAVPGIILAVASGFDFTSVMNGVPPQPAEFAKLGTALLYFFVLVLVILWASARLLPINAVVAMERRGVGAIRRAFELTRGMTLKLIGVLILYAIVAGVAVSAAQFVVGGILGLLIGNSGAFSPTIIVSSFAVAAVSAALALYQSAFVGKLYREVVGQQDDAAVFA